MATNEYTISELTPADAAHPDDLVETSQIVGAGYVSKRITLDQVTSLVATSDQIAGAIEDAIAAIPDSGSAELPVTGGDPIDTGLSRISAGVVGVGNGTASNVSGTLNAAQVVVGNAGVSPARLSIEGMDGQTPYAFEVKAAGVPKITIDVSGNLAVHNDTLFHATAIFGPAQGLRISSNGYFSAAANPISWSGTTHAYDVADTGLSRISAGIVGVGNGTAGNASGTLNADKLVTSRSMRFGDSLAGTSAGFYGDGVDNIAIRGYAYGGSRGIYLQAQAGETYAKFVNTGAEIYGPLTLTGALTGTTATLSTAISAASNDTTVPTTAWVKANAGSSISTGTTPPVSPTAGQMWWNTDAAVGGGAMYIYYDSFWVPASPGVGSGAVVQTVNYQTGAVATGTTILPNDNTIPQITEGDQYMTLAITPKSATSRLIVTVTAILSNSIVAWISCALFRDSTANALSATTTYMTTATGIVTLTFQHVVVSGSTASTTFRVRAGGNGASTTTFNGSTGAQYFGGVCASSIVIQEVL